MTRIPIADVVLASAVAALVFLALSEPASAQKAIVATSGVIAADGPAYVDVRQNGHAVRLLGTLPDDARVCAEPAEGTTGTLKCFTLAELRRATTVRFER
jgi:hypothetical protein